jgi:hypothetical protein
MFGNQRKQLKKSALMARGLAARVVAGEKRTYRKMARLCADW